MKFHVMPLVMPLRVGRIHYNQRNDGIYQYTCGIVQKLPSTFCMCCTSWGLAVAKRIIGDLCICIDQIKHLHWVTQTLSNCIWRDCWSYTNPNNWRKCCIQHLKYLVFNLYFSLCTKKGLKIVKKTTLIIGGAQSNWRKSYSLFIYSEARGF